MNTTIDSSISVGDTAYVWNKHPQLAAPAVITKIDSGSDKPYIVSIFGYDVACEHAKPVATGHPARDLHHELMSMFPKETYGHSALSEGQAWILLRWASSLPVVFLDGTEDIVKISMQDGVITVVEMK